MFSIRRVRSALRCRQCSFMPAHPDATNASAAATETIHRGAFTTSVYPEEELLRDSETAEVCVRIQANPQCDCATSRVMFHIAHDQHRLWSSVHVKTRFGAS